MRAGSKTTTSLNKIAEERADNWMEIGQETTRVYKGRQKLKSLTSAKDGRV